MAKENLMFDLFRRKRKPQHNQATPGVAAKQTSATSDNGFWFWGLFDSGSCDHSHTSSHDVGGQGDGGFDAGGFDGGGCDGGGGGGGD
jgi:hypothetical protein